MSVEIIPVIKVARELKKSPESIQKALQAGVFPVGSCYRYPGGRFQYIIPRDAWERFKRGEIAGRLKGGEHGDM